MIRRGWCLRFALVLALFAGHGAALLASTDISESADKISVSTQTYRLEIARDGYELKLLRGKTVVFQSAGKDSPMPSLGFQSGQKAQHLTRLKSVH